MKRVSSSRRTRAVPRIEELAPRLQPELGEYVRHELRVIPSVIRIPSWVPCSRTLFWRLNLHLSFPTLGGDEEVSAKGTTARGAGGSPLFVRPPKRRQRAITHCNQEWWAVAEVPGECSAAESPVTSNARQRGTDARWQRERPRQQRRAAQQRARHSHRRTSARRLRATQPQILSPRQRQLP